MCKKEYPINEKSDIPFLYIRCRMTHASVDKNNKFSKKLQKLTKFQVEYKINFLLHIKSCQSV